MYEHDSNPYLIPNDGLKRVVHFSGGRSSAYLLYQIIQTNRLQTPDVQVVFCNTGKEREETLEFVRRCQVEWGWNIHWLEYHYDRTAKGGRADPKHVAVQVYFPTASRKGEPFEEMIQASSMLPNVAMRKCTSELKVRTCDRWCRRVLGWPKHRGLLGIRYDEPRRWRKALMEECRTDYPLMHAKVIKQDVDDFWAKHSFDLGISSRLGNCDLCFLKGKANLLRTIDKEPERAQWWIDQEQKSVKILGKQGYGPRMAQFSKRHTFAELLDEAKVGSAQLSLLDDDDVGIDCFCGE